MNPQLTNLLIGIRRWVNGKLEDITYVISSHINELTSRMTTVEGKVDELIIEGGEPNVIETVKVNGTALTPDANKAVDILETVTGIKSGEKILAFDATNTSELTTTLSIDIEKQSNIDYIVLKGINGTEISKVNASAFVSDGMLSSATLHTRTTTQTTEEPEEPGGEPVVTDVVTWSPALPQGVTEPAGTIDGTYIVLVWNTDAGTNPMFLNVTTLVDIYAAGTGLTLTGNTFSLNAATADTIGGVKVAAAATSGLTLAADGSLSIEAIAPADVVDILDDEETYPYPTPVVGE